MEISIKGKNLDVGDALRGHVEENLNTTVTKYFEKALDAKVVYSRVSHSFRVDISVHPWRGLVVQGQGSADDAYAAFDGALDRITKQLRKYKSRIRDHHKSRGENEEVLPAQYSILAPEGEEADDGGAIGDNPAIVAEMPHGISTLSVSEAVMRMDLANTPVMMFRNSAHGGLNVVYRRADGNIGWIDPSDAN